MKNKKNNIHSSVSWFYYIYLYILIWLFTLVDQKGQALKQFSGRLSRTANIVAVANARNKRRLVDNINQYILFGFEQIVNSQRRMDILFWYIRGIAYFVS